ncbi:hypothetical protein ABZ307_28455 [Streptomyces griseorubiginosus]|uniref:hypothetical protein n=1 Tax=Streptomyces griseorubiginosus TaxID=67304 RepID=UPI00339EABAA
MSLDVASIFDQVESHLHRTGLFDQVGMHEPKSAPGNGLSAEAWVEQITAVAAVSGLSTAGVRLEMNIRVRKNMLSEPQDEIDVVVLGAVDLLMNNFAGDFELDGEVMHVDVLGAYGTPLNARATYIEQDKRMYRAMTISLPLIIDNAWAEVA